ncbi:MAG TPA: hypothetical protein DHV14_14580 [Micrococcales bacterium]|nr:hypothetical protein [Micrococcales bacterium]
MRVLGIAVRVSSWKSTVSLTLLEAAAGGGRSAPTVVESVQVTEHDGDWAVHVGNVSKAVRGHMTSMRPDSVVVRRADQARQTRNSDGPKLRLMIEGGIIAASLDATGEVQVLTGQECAKACSTIKDDLDARAGRMVPNGYAEAAAAALAALA